MLFVGTSIIHPSTEGVFLLCNILDLLIYSMKHAFTTIPGVLWIVTAVVLFFYRLNKKRYNEIVEELKNGRKS